MSDATIGPGCILHWEGFTFADGAEANKFFVIVGAHPGKNFLAVIATSKKKKKDDTPGGNPQGGYYFIPGGSKDWFKLDTWLLFDQPREISAAEMVKEHFAKRIVVKGNLRPDIANAICNAMRKCDDVAEIHKGLLGPVAR